MVAVSARLLEIASSQPLSDWTPEAFVAVGKPRQRLTDSAREVSH